MTPAAEAVLSVEALLESPSFRVLRPGERYWTLLARMVRAGTVQGNLVFDAQIAALCLEHGASTILTEDRDFARFEGMRVLPLAEFGALRESAPAYAAPKARRARGSRVPVRSKR